MGNADKKKIAKQIDEMLVDPWEIDLQELHDYFIDEKDEDKKRIFDALYHCVLHKRQEDVINQKNFVI
ncbi:MAG: hypothetical protein L0K26_10315 [Enterococcaceae bacterium]|nr:hypothetical protein [Tetragenococcus koreensis]MDN6257958.1 hypothetical protein [Tetragenococcus halophilus]MDN6470349.1 hypothetical protein [Enterococcaceae bacterium]MDN6504519.1 hypothetical protein [Tetragenococcus halophilus]MDN6508766.1 hypothetical protein [Tetragenococcus halophilus]